MRLHDGTFAGRAGWKAIVVVPGTGTAVRSSVPAEDPTARPAPLPAGAPAQPARAARGDVRRARRQRHGDRPARRRRRHDHDPRPLGPTASPALLVPGAGLSLLLLAAAFGWGAVHALSPGHGKAMVAAYLVGTRGTPRHAVALGLAVTVTHTIGVFALGVVTLALSEHVVPEDLYPWLNLVAGLLVAVVGASLLRRRLRERRRERGRGGGTTITTRSAITWRGLAAMGVSAGIVPCPSALVVLLAAIAQHRVGLGLVLIVAFSAGLAATLTALGLAVVWSGRALTRIRVPGRAVAALPTASALVIVAVGCLLTVRALPGIS